MSNQTSPSESVGFRCALVLPKQRSLGGLTLVNRVSSCFSSRFVFCFETDGDESSITATIIYRVYFYHHLCIESCMQPQLFCELMNNIFHKIYFHLKSLAVILRHRVRMTGRLKHHCKRLAQFYMVYSVFC
jgi:hypothetical protein